MIAPQLFPFLFSASMCSKEKVVSPLRCTEDEMQALGGDPRARTPLPGNCPCRLLESPFHQNISAVTILTKLTSQAVISVPAVTHAARHRQSENRKGEGRGKKKKQTSKE